MIVWLPLRIQRLLYDVFWDWRRSLGLSWCSTPSWAAIQSVEGGRLALCLVIGMAFIISKEREVTVMNQVRFAFRRTLALLMLMQLLLPLAAPAHQAARAEAAAEQPFHFSTTWKTQWRAPCPRKRINASAHTSKAVIWMKIHPTRDTI